MYELAGNKREGTRGVFWDAAGWIVITGQICNNNHGKVAEAEALKTSECKSRWTLRSEEQRRPIFGGVETDRMVWV